MTPFSLIFKEQIPLNDHSVVIRFQVDSKAPFVAIAGQFVRLHMQQDDGFDTFRSYSIANIFPSEKCELTEIEIAMTWVKGGLATRILSEMQPGDRLEASGPYGRFCLLPDHHQRYFLIATGTGVTPYRAMLNELKNRLDAGSEVYVVMGAQDAPGLLYEEDFRAVEKAYENFHYIPCLSRRQRDEAALNDRMGYVQKFLAEQSFDADSDIAYLCGNPDMVDESFALLKDKGLPITLIKREKYVSPPVKKK
ncbi:FAD-binding oxidoreductase [Marinicella gelatinilytica]|uniref:FAD-binding oxidoreductase n=1 Tax=Marinicella gelatinilytica TaxID=2996017 RepID=UPI002261016D|nr:FAD-binding oxidoreductase [Marinicella gelatinilytica]MCX7545932.1 FAD-binding oxidoreductase [Marinicella gelatinilytica]